MDDEMVERPFGAMLSFWAIRERASAHPTPLLSFWTVREGACAHPTLQVSCWTIREGAYAHPTLPVSLGGLRTSHATCRPPRPTSRWQSECVLFSGRNFDVLARMCPEWYYSQGIRSMV